MNYVLELVQCTFWVELMYCYRQRPGRVFVCLIKEIFFEFICVSVQQTCAIHMDFFYSHQKEEKEILLLYCDTNARKILMANATVEFISITSNTFILVSHCRLISTYFYHILQQASSFALKARGVECISMCIWTLSF